MDGQIPGNTLVSEILFLWILMSTLQVGDVDSKARSLIVDVKLRDSDMAITKTDLNNLIGSNVSAADKK